ncbi:alpha/beta hydrolase [Nocardioides sp.]|uniref:alpha/beta hydrolase n=1 Tax=Nocardioides sp. TaxID=35761 RepID=UPI002B27B4E8|nr:alpha/beta hydrolase [Nocardioides sp.]
MSLSDSIEALALRITMGLPEGVQRRLGGTPIVLDGQTLAAETQLMLRLKQVAKLPSAEELPIPEGREVIAHESKMAGGAQPIGAVRDLPVGDLPARLYVPTTAAPEPGPLLVFFHGGGFMYGDLDSHDATCRVLAERAGVRVLAIDYRLAPEHPFPAAHDDALTAYRWVVKHAASIGADPQRLAVGGDSAGGNLAAATAIAAAQEGLPLAFQLLVYPSVNVERATRSLELFSQGFYLTAGFMDLATDSYTPDLADRDDIRVSPLLHDVPAGLAPAYVCTAGFDPLRDEGEAYARALEDAGVSVVMHRFPDLIHGFFNIVGVGRRSRAAVLDIADALKTGLDRG